MANSFKSLLKTGFGLGFGLQLSNILFIIIGAAFFIPGYILLMKNKKEKDSDQTTPLVLMGIGVLIMGGLGFGLFSENLGELFE
jgi:hypothetical protein